MTQSDSDTGGGQVLVVYRPTDTGQELIPEVVLAEIAEDSARRAAEGRRIVSMTWAPLRHAGAMLGNDGSGYQTKAANAVVYGRVGE